MGGSGRIWEEAGAKGGGGGARESTAHTYVVEWLAAVGCGGVIGRGMGLTGAAGRRGPRSTLYVLTFPYLHTFTGAYLYLIWTRRAELGLDPLPPRVHPAEAWQQYAPFLQAGGAVLMRTAVLLGTKTLGAAVATRLGPASIASHQVRAGVGGRREQRG